MRPANPLLRRARAASSRCSCPARRCSRTGSPMRGADLNVDNQSFYAQDHWTINRHLSADLGVRYERVRSEATGGLIGVDTDTVVPRLALALRRRRRRPVGLPHHLRALRRALQRVADWRATPTSATPTSSIGVYTGPAGQGSASRPVSIRPTTRSVARPVPDGNVVLRRRAVVADHARSSRCRAAVLVRRAAPTPKRPTSGADRRTSSRTSSSSANGSTDVVGTASTTAPSPTSSTATPTIRERRYQAAGVPGALHAAPQLDGATPRGRSS